MGATFSRYFVEAPGNTILADHWNGEFDNILDNLTPSGIDDSSSNTTAMQTTVSPGTVGSESLATDLAGELQRLRHMLKVLGGGLYWYSTPVLSTGELRNAKLDLTTGTLSIVPLSGSYSTSNPGYVTCPDASGISQSLRITTTASFNDDTHASSDLTNFEAGVSAGANWSEDCPWFWYVVNVSNTDIDGTDGHSAFFITRNPAMQLTPSDVANIWTTNNSAANDTQHCIMLLGNLTVASYTSKPCRLIGAFRMRYLTSSHDWTVQTLNSRDGLGAAQLERFFSNVWTMPNAQNGAIADGHLKNANSCNFLSEVFKWTLDAQGYVRCFLNFAGNTTRDGSTGSTTTVALPLSADGLGADTLCFGAGYVRNPGVGSVGMFAEAIQNSTSMDFFTTGGTVLIDSHFSDGDRNLDVNLTYKAF